MSKKRSIEDQEKELNLREERVKQQLDSDSDEFREKLARVGKIAAISGVVALVGYWVYRTFFGEENEEKEEESRKPKANKPSRGRLAATLSTMALPYLEKILDGFFDEKEEKEKTKKGG